MEIRLVLCELGGEQLDGDETAQAGIISQLNFTHPARAEQRANLVASESCVGRKSHRFDCGARPLGSQCSTGSVSDLSGGIER
ncbi:MAG: hypothetical protein ACR2LZ_12980, partial [Pyrinomonadaceae bacterium]